MNKHIYTAELVEVNGEQEYTIPLAIEADSFDEADKIANEIAADWYEDATLDESGMWYNSDCSWQIAGISGEYYNFVYTSKNTTRPCIVRYV